MPIFAKNENTKASKTVTLIAEGVSIEGKIYSPGSTRIDGSLKGMIISEKELIVGKEGKVEADAKTNNATIAGSFKGDIIASGEVEITSTGKLIGNLTQKDALLTVSKGGVFKGESKISDNADIFKMGKEQIIPEHKPADGKPASIHPQVNRF
ncbi:MAG: polymer-forming cytoskeletal protein [Actinomycetota bacterium]|jgi:cytoskeletal protein CcmA (bactofilin family)|nr:polymer-forming cytoskeletal protein [Actinomycetota bacterium]